MFVLAQHYMWQRIYGYKITDPRRELTSIIFCYTSKLVNQLQ